MPETITLGGRSFEVKKLPITHLLQLAEIVDEPVPQKIADLIGRSAKIISVALRHADPTLSEEGVRAMGASLDDLNTAVATIMRVAGFRAGEAEPAVAGFPNSSTTLSEPLPPDADTDRPISIN